MNGIMEKLSAYKLIPVIKIEDTDKALPLAKALIDGGLPVAEITFRASGAEKVIAMITKEYPDMLVGAGTVLTVKQVKMAVDAGAKFIVSPGLNPNVVSYCLENDITVIPGCITPTEIERAMELGLSILKFFPAEAAGGIKMIKALSAPYTNIKFIPTGGIGTDNLLSYLSVKNVIAVGGSFMVKEEYLKNNDFDAIKNITKSAVDLIKGM